MNDKKIAIASSIIGIGITIGVVLYTHHLEKKTEEDIQRIRENGGDKRLLNKLEETIEALDKQIETAKFWDIVTQEEF